MNHESQLQRTETVKSSGVGYGGHGMIEDLLIVGGTTLQALFSFIGL